MLALFVFFGNFPVLADSPDSSGVVKKDVKDSKKLEQKFKKKSGKRSEEEIAQDQEYKFQLVPENELGPDEGYSGGVGPTSKDGIGIYSDGFGEPKGTNNISFELFDAGDIILVHDGRVPWGYYRHAGLWDSDYYSGSLEDNCIWEANVTPTSDVHLAPASKFRRYDEAVGLFVKDARPSERYNTTVFAYLHRGEPYDALTDIHVWTSWYCSKLIWAAYWDKTDKKIDLRGGSRFGDVYPDDIYISNHVTVFATGT